MKRIALIAAMLLFGLAFAAQAQMSDDQVVEYVKTALAAGKSQEAITQELLLRGVTQEQAERIRDRVQGQQAGGGQETGSFGDDAGFVRSSGATGRGSAVTGVTTGRTLRDGTYEQDYFANQRAATQARRQSRRQVNLDSNRDRSRFELLREALEAEEKEAEDLEGLLDLFGSGEFYDLPDSLKVFGHDIFDGSGLSFEPNENLATPESYQLGPGDQLLIEIFGYSEGSYSRTISPEGTINISQVGQLQLGGLTIGEAKEKLRRALASKYASVGGSRPNSTVSITLRDIRTIQVNVMGEVAMPGTFRLSPFATVFNALYNAGGVTEDGSLRAIKVIRGGQQIATVDVYGYLFDGRSDSDITLKEGDVVIVPPYVNLVYAGGQVKRPMFYEMAEGEPLIKLVEYAGGFGSRAFQDDIRVIRQQGAERQIYTVRQSDFGSFAMADGDEIYVNTTLERFSNKVEVKGSVFRPGMFELGGDIATVRQLVRAAGGLTEDAFIGRAVIVRERDDLNFETLSVDLAGILAGTSDDVVLRKNDILTVSSNKELLDPGTLTINGYVQKPGVFPYAANTTVEDLILLAGGLIDGASTARVDVSRRVSDPAGLSSSSVLGESFSFALKDGLAVDGGDRFVLQPYDIVSVRKSPAYRKQQFVELAGEVNFPGRYVLEKEGERLSEVIERAGGPTNLAFLRGATLTRQLTEEEAAQQKVKLKLLESVSGKDTLNVASVTVDQNYAVSIELDKAMKNPGTSYDPVLQEGDRIYIPGQQSTVRISGAVLYPNTVAYVPGKGYRYYIDAAGGFSGLARKRSAYIVYMNGMARPAQGGGFDYSAKIEPGCEIIVPEKGSRSGMSTSEVLAISSSAASLATMVATLIRLF